MLVAHLRVETLDKPVLPGTARINMQRVRSPFRQPAFQFLGDEFRTIVLTDKCWIAILVEKIGKDADQIV